METEKEKNTKTIVLTKEYFSKYREWLSLDLESISWEGKHKRLFEEFWDLFFLDGIDLGEVIHRFHYSSIKIKIGPLNSWLSWLCEKFLVYIFITKNLNITEIVSVSGIERGTLASILRDFFVNKYPLKEKYFNEVFQVANVLSPNLFLDFNKIKKDLDLELPETGEFEDEIMPGLEVTLYEDWSDFTHSLKVDFFHPEFSVSKIKKELGFQKQIKFFQRVLLLLFLAGFITFLLQTFNVWYEKYIADKISIYEPQFLWVDKALKFQQKEEDFISNFTLNLESIENVPDHFVRATELGKEEERTDTESEVVLTSWADLPQDFEYADQERSEYEEQKKESYRDTSFGDKKVYRVMMKSENPLDLKKHIVDFLKKYEVTQGDKVQPGTLVPGGLYYNLFVPRKFLKEFLSQVMSIGEAVLYESRTSVGNLPGTNKVFIWVKNI